MGVLSAFLALLLARSLVVVGPADERPVLSVRRVVAAVRAGNAVLHAPTGAVLVQLRWLALEGRPDPVHGFEQPVFAWK